MKWIFSDCIFRNTPRRESVVKAKLFKWISEHREFLYHYREREREKIMRKYF